MNRRIGVLVIDDSAVARRVIASRLAKDAQIEVVGVADSATTGLAHLRRDPPDVVVLDLELPDMRGPDVLRAIRREHPTVAVVVFSARVGSGTQARFEALLLGADDAVAKPTTAAGPVRDDHPTWSELLSKTKSAALRPTRGGVDVAVARAAPPLPSSSGLPAPHARALGGGSTGGSSTSTPPDSSTRRPVRPLAAPVVPPHPRDGARRSATRRSMAMSASADLGVCVMASSTGGPDALAQVFEALPADFPLPILVVQHMPVHFTKLLADRIDARSVLQVREAAGGEPIVAGTAHVAPGGHHLVVAARAMGCVTALDHGPAEHSCRPAADALFRSAVAAYGGRIVACVLSGMGSDGLAGASLVHAAGGTVIAQDQATSVVWGMPGAVVEAGIADALLPLPDLATELTAAAWRVASTPRRRTRSREVTT